MSGTVLFICTGNICRSPIAEAMFRHALGALEQNDPVKNLVPASAGISTIDGMPASKNSVDVLAKVGISLDGFKSSALTQEMVDKSFAIFGMDESHMRALKSNFKIAHSRVMPMLKLNPKAEYTDIPDPYGGSVTEYLEVRDDIAAAIPFLMKYLSNELKNI